MTEVKTKPNDASVEDFLNNVQNPRRQRDARQVCAAMARVTGKPPCMWGTSIVGFDTYSYQQHDGTKANWPMIGFSPRKASLTVYVMPGFAAYERLLQKLGPHSKSVSCLYLTNLEKNDAAVLESIIRETYSWMCAKYGA